MRKYECCIDRVEFMDEKTPQSIPTSPSHRRKPIRLLENGHNVSDIGSRSDTSFPYLERKGEHPSRTEGLPSSVSEDKR
jgi:hypothetical protein